MIALNLIEVIEMGEIKEEWAKSIIGQALAEIKTLEDIPRVIKKVEGTAIGMREDLMKTFLGLVEMKKKMIGKW